MINENLYDEMERINELIDIKDEYLKDSLKEINFKLCNLAKSNKEFPIEILIENLNTTDINYSIDMILEMLYTYNFFKDFDDNVKLFDENLKLNKNDLVIVNDFDFFYDEIIDSSYHLRKFKKKIEENSCSIIISCKDMLSNYYDFKDNFIKDSIEIKITGKSYSSKEILEKLKNMYNKNKINIKIKNNELIKIINSTLESASAYPSTCAEFLYDYSIKQKILNGLDYIDKTCFKQDLKETKTTPKLKDLVGLKNVKNEVKILKNFLEFRKKLNIQDETLFLNLLFLGNPGTGKTTVAKCYSEILYNLGYIKENKLIEIIPTDLMANYVGQTKDKTRKILDKAKGGVLFIDEAYLIAREVLDGCGTFMNEAVVEIIKYMENKENVIIFAGYSSETKELYKVNPGIKSRICKEIYFDDFTSNELLTIIKKDLKNLGLKTDKSSEKKIKEVIEREKKSIHFGNARFAKIYVQEILMKHANNNKNSFIIDESDVAKTSEKTNNLGFLGGLK